MSITTAKNRRIHSGRSAEKAIQGIFGFPSDIISKAIKGAHDASLFITPLYPKTAKGTMRYFEIVNGLRESLYSFGWSRECENGLELTVSPNRKLAIMVKPGDECTGVDSRDFTPKLKRPVGLATQRVVERNKPPYLFPELDKKTIPPQTTPETWILLHRYAQNTIQAELSLPSGFEGEMNVVSWVRRICLPDIPIDNSSDIDVALPVKEYPDFDVSVKRKK